MHTHLWQYILSLDELYAYNRIIMDFKASDIKCAAQALYIKRRKVLPEDH